jgi:hypothetical protein
MTGSVHAKKFGLKVTVIAMNVEIVAGIILLSALQTYAGAIISTCDIMQGRFQ